MRGPETGIDIVWGVASEVNPPAVSIEAQENWQRRCGEAWTTALSTVSEFGSIGSAVFDGVMHYTPPVEYVDRDHRSSLLYLSRHAESDDDMETFTESISLIANILAEGEVHTFSIYQFSRNNLTKLGEQPCDHPDLNDALRLLRDMRAELNAQRKAELAAAQSVASD